MKKGEDGMVKLDHGGGWQSTTKGYLSTAVMEPFMAIRLHSLITFLSPVCSLLNQGTL